jgi:hypothetical protein
MGEPRHDARRTLGVSSHGLKIFKMFGALSHTLLRHPQQAERPMRSTGSGRY